MTAKNPTILEGNDLKALAKYMNSDRCRNVFLMVSYHDIWPFDFDTDAMTRSDWGW